MSETSPDESDEPVSMTKPARPAKPARPGRPAGPKVSVPIPVTVKGAMAGLALTIVGAVLRAYAIHSASDSTLGKILTHSNAHAKSPKKHYVPGDKTFDKDLHTLHTAYTPLAVVAALIAILLILGLRTPRYASATRWFVIVLMLYPTGSLFGAFSPYGFPSAAQAGGILITVGALAAIVLNFLRPSAAYFAACRDATMTPERKAAAASRPKLFGPRSAPAGRQPAARPAARPATPSTGGGKAKAKARNDAEAVARGAELARNRARASKSRRTDV